ncbi:hypothetical protein ACQ4PT_004199 [Festuca glaucescens]
MGAFLPILLPAVAANAGLLAKPSHGLNQDGLYLLDAKRALTLIDGALADWNPCDAMPCRWTGISCDAIPDDLFEVPKLETLHLNSNVLMGPVPESAVKAASLVELRLFANRLNGTLPPDLGKNTPQVCFDVSDNSISGEIPRGICDCGELEELLMLNNALTRRIPQGAWVVP